MMQCFCTIKTWMRILYELDALPIVTQKTEEPKNKGNFTFPTHTVNVLCK